MDTSNYNTESRKHKHLNTKERYFIELRLNDGWLAYCIAKELNRPINTILNEIRRGSTTQIVQHKAKIVYLADTGEAVYQRNRKACRPNFKRITCSGFVNQVCINMKGKKWSVDATVGALVNSVKYKSSETVCTKTMYNYIDLGLVPISNTELPLKLRRNTKPKRIKKHKRQLGTSIEERPESINDRLEFGHWEIDTVIGLKTTDDPVLLTLSERKTRNFIVRSILSKTAEAVIGELNNIKEFFGSKFDKVFKTITGDNGLEFAKLSSLENNTNTKVYFAHPYSSYERGTNERHNGLIRKFIPKGAPIANFNIDDIAAIEDWCNTLPRKILGYNSPEELFDNELDIIYAC